MLVSPPSPIPIGWKEYLDLPSLGLLRMKAKIDTGARTSTLHVDSLRYVESPGETAAAAGIEADAAFCPDRNDPSHVVTARVHVLRHLSITDSGGHRETRPLIETDLRLGPVHKRILVTLTDRADMLFRFILGRKALEGDFLVDPQGKYRLRAWHRPLRRDP